MIQSRIKIDRSVQLFGEMTIEEAQETRQALRNVLLLDTDPTDQMVLSRLLAAFPNDNVLLMSNETGNWAGGEQP